MLVSIWYCLPFSSLKAMNVDLARYDPQEWVDNISDITNWWPAKTWCVISVQNNTYSFLLPWLDNKCLVLNSKSWEMNWFYSSKNLLFQIIPWWVCTCSFHGHRFPPTTRCDWLSSVPFSSNVNLLLVGDYPIHLAWNRSSSASPDSISA